MASHKCMVESTFYCEMETIWANMCDGTNIERVHGQLRAMPKATVEALVARQQPPIGGPLRASERRRQCESPDFFRSCARGEDGRV